MKNLYENLCFAIGLILVGGSFASEYPVYSEDTSRLQLPTVKVEDQAGVYQELELVFETDDQLRMVALKEGVLLGDVIKEVKLFQTDTFPVQVFLQVSGEFPDGCGEIGQVLQERDGSMLNIYAYYANDGWPDTANKVCTLAVRPFTHVLALDVYGLPAGTYHYQLNDSFTGSFTLATDNDGENAGAYAAPYPHYDEDSSLLTLPAIDSAGQTARFQQGVLELVSDNLWQLQDVYEAKLNESIERVELIKTNTFPVQVLLEISGVYPHGCARTGQTHVRLEGSSFNVSSFYQNNLWIKTPQTVLCIAATQPFSFIHPLPVYGLPAGSYEYEVNGKFSGSFTLNSHNVFNPSGFDR